MKRVLLLAATTGYQTRAFGDAAADLGVELVFATDRCHMLDDPWRDRAIPIRFHDEAESTAAILDAARGHRPDGVLAVGDRPTVIAARVAQELGIPWHPPEAAASAGHKQRTRERLSAAGLPVPWFLPLSLTADPVEVARSLPFPAVVKPVALSGSRGVIRADDPEAFVRAFDRLRALLASPEIRAERNEAHDRLLVERFIPGREYALEGLMDRGRLHPLALFDKPDPLDGPYFEETVYLTPSSASPAEQQAIVEGISRAAEAIGLRHGPVHAECRVNDAGVFVLEVAARPIGGLCARALRFADRLSPASPHVSLETALLRHCLGEAPDRWVREPAASGVLMMPIPRRGLLRRVEGVDAARRVAGVDDVRVTAKIDQLLVPLPEGASYLGFVFARGERPSDVDRALRTAHGRLVFTIDAEIPLLAPERP